MSGSAAGAAAAGRGGAGGTGGPAAGSGGGTTGATFTEVYSLIMTGCGCHNTAQGAGGLATMTKSAAYTNLVGATSTECSGQKRVVAGNPDSSVLFLSLNRTNMGDCMPPPMPRGAAKLPQADLDKVRSWIMAGALNN
jgi:hypothetical protein